MNTQRTVAFNGRGPMSESSASTHVVIVGGGLAGVACAHLLADDRRTRVTLLDRTGQHQFQPLLYQVATAELSQRDMTFTDPGCSSTSQG